MTAIDVPETHDALEGITPPQLSVSVQGHSGELEFLAESIAHDKLHHALIFEGERGIGKATIAFHIANRLLDSRRAITDTALPAPDPQSSVFRQIAQGAHPGLLYLSRPRNDQGTGFKTAITVDEIRRLQRFFAMTAAGADSYRVVVIDPVNDLNRNAANALLKLLEEPPARSVFILIAHGTGGLLPTIRSRCQILKFAPLSDADIRHIVRGQLGADFDETTLDRIAALGGGSARRALVFAQFGGLDLMEALEAFLKSPRPDVAQAHKLAEIAGARKNEVHRDILRELVLDRLRNEATMAARRGNLRAAERIAIADMAIQDHMRLSDAFNLDRKQDFLSMLSDVHDLISAVRAG
ncbi:DNA polymerase III subunit delta' [Oricola nitratireducens]|uniref:DNA polymerase III subunit delta' n=1 Tax=Oricola nitratireducens TaxID=2775868 RepID=UPI001868BDF1|nr:DNA polymerase III subunit delta' [Oricola nitratireducens]